MTLAEQIRNRLTLKRKGNNPGLKANTLVIQALLQENQRLAKQNEKLAKRTYDALELTAAFQNIIIAADNLLHQHGVQDTDLGMALVTTLTPGMPQPTAAPEEDQTPQGTAAP